ncbi:propionyl-CoA carboxylase beta chain [Neorhodopirellula lusitana]|uniref:Propionyl-CoA carboxylase beta chain n=1 Tax=Neorhodopirellula lusitana TaxID=445327 RepID=A0ABY1QD87_9BACT|nr:acyl-CoA carboxylase subunit beta [Neorhodopirellula lusitana]SMP67492.1 propionyl-CoA carboxylase beta chain [Neorhodopirellula lusitana]
MAIKKELLERLKKQRSEALAGGGEARIEKHHAKGAMTARERFEELFEPGTFLESGMHVQHNCHDFGMEKKSLPGDGVVTGVGQVGGRAVAGFSQDFTVGGGALGQRHSKKICEMMDYAADCGLPFVAINDSGGARIQEGVDSLSGYGQVFYRNVQLSGLVPQIAIIAGSCAGGAAYSPALMDFLIMTRDNASMFICGPAVIKAATGVETTMEEIGGAAANATISGNVHFVAENDAHAIEITKELLSYLPSNNLDNPPHHLSEHISMEADPAVNNLIPEDAKGMLDMLPIISRIFDDGKFLQVHEHFATSLMVGFARLDGVVVGVIANQPKVKAGTLDIDASDKGARFIRFCNAFNIPLITLVDVPGFLPGVHQEQGGIIRHGAKMLFAYSAATVPKITLIIRKAYGGAYLAMCSRDMGADAVYAWPTAEIAVMGADGATNVLYRREIQAAENSEEKRAELVKEYHDRFASPYMAASRGMITDVIEPAMSRATLSLALRNTLQKSETRPPKKHGLIPL